MHFLFCLAVTFYRSSLIYLSMENTTPAASFCSSHNRSSHLPLLFTRSFSSTQCTSFQNILLSLFLRTSVFIGLLSAFFDFVYLKYWAVFTFDFFVLCISSLRLSLFFEIISLFNDKEKSCYLSIEYFLGSFGTGIIFFKRLEEVTS